MTHHGVTGGEVEVGGGVLGDRRREWLTVTEDGVDGRHHFAVMDGGDHTAQLVAGAEVDLGSDGGRLARWMKGLVEEAADGPGALSAPQVDEVVVDVAGGEHVDGRGERLLLGGEQGLVVEPGPLAEEQLDEQLGADVAEVLDRVCPAIAWRARRPAAVAARITRSRPRPAA